MEINNVFKNEKDELLERIENLPVFNCIQNFDKYLNTKADSDFERRYITSLNNNIEDLGREILIKNYESLEKEELLKKLVLAHIDAPYSFMSYFENEEIPEFFDNYGYNDADAHSIIKKYMIDEYKKLVDTVEQTSKNQRRKAIEKLIEEAEQTLNRYEKNLIEYRNELVELDKE